MILGKIIEKVGEALGLTKFTSIATGGSTTTIVDTALATRYATNGFKQHIVIITKTTDGAAPQGEFGLFPTAHWVTATKTFTIPTVSAAVEAGDLYTVIKPTIPIYELLSQINVGLGKLDAIALVDTSLTTLNETREYTLPIATKGYEIQDVKIGNSTTGYFRHTDYLIRRAVGGSTETIVFTTQPPIDLNTPANHTIEITYLAKPSVLSVYSDAVSEKYADELVISQVALSVLEYHMNKKRLYRNRNWIALLSHLQGRLGLALQESPVEVLPAEDRGYHFGEL